MVQCVCVMWLFDKLLGGEFMPILASREKVMKKREVPMGKGEELIKDSGRESLPCCSGEGRRLVRYILCLYQLDRHTTQLEFGRDFNK